MADSTGWLHFGTKAFRYDVWETAVSDLKADGGIGHSEFINFGTGAAMLLACDGEWRTGGEFRVFYLAPSGTISEVSRLLWKMDRTFPVDSDEWSKVKARCVEYLVALLDAKPGHDAVTGS